MTNEDRNYFERRAEEELAKARSARHESAARAHYLMAGHYLDIVHNGYESWCSVTGRGELVT